MGERGYFYYLLSMKNSSFAFHFYLVLEFSSELNETLVETYFALMHKPAKFLVPLQCCVISTLTLVPVSIYLLILLICRIYLQIFNILPFIPSQNLLVRIIYRTRFWMLFIKGFEIREAFLSQLCKSISFPLTLSIIEHSNKYYEWLKLMLNLCHRYSKADDS